MDAQWTLRGRSVDAQVDAPWTLRWTFKWTLRGRSPLSPPQTSYHALRGFMNIDIDNNINIIFNNKININIDYNINIIF